MGNKQFKDPIYGYINIDSDIVAKIIDTPAFQRLKDIRQTSYAPLYPAAYHNRYVHSLGVYHLGRIAFGAIKPQLIEKSKETEIETCISTIQKIFELACLLHDVGHAPFSHTGENFFLDNEGTLYKNLKDVVNEANFTADFDALGTKKPAPHECMSCIVGLKTFSDFFHDAEERGFFARCIIGMAMRFTEKQPRTRDDMRVEEKKEVAAKYNLHKSKKTAIELLNCVISLLNSSIIDVDRLDYIIRDAATIGFKNVQVDYMRLLKGMRIVSNANDKVLCIGYHKSAISVIESAVYAHDSEKKWVQGHPAILYEMEVLKHAMSSLTTLFATREDSNPLFCYEALTESGKILSLSSDLLSEEAKKLLEKESLLLKKAKVLLNHGKLFAKELGIDSNNFIINREYPISLLADEDVLYLMKNFCKESLGYEYFARNKRRSAVWKSEAEFRALFQERIGDDSKSIKTLEKDFEGLVEYCQGNTGMPIVDKDIFEKLDREKEEADRAQKNMEIDQESFEDIIKGIQTKRHWGRTLEKIAVELNIEFKFLIIFQKKFSSSFKATVGDILILFPNIAEGVVPLKNVVDVINSDSDKKSNFFHLFYTPIGIVNDARKKAIVNGIAEGLIRGINDKISN